MRVVLVAGDYGESRVFRLLEMELKRRGQAVQSFLAEGKPPSWSAESLNEAVAQADCILLAFADSVAETLRAGELARQRLIPVGLYSGLYGSHRLPDFAELRPCADFLFTLNLEEARDARQYFPRAEVISVGNPLWEEFFAERYPRKEIRRQLQLAEGETAILCPGDKDLILNILLFGLVIEAAHMLRTDWRPKVFIGLHPGDPNPPAAYAELARRSQVPVIFLNRETTPTPDVLPGIDVVVTFVSSVGIQTACLRKPVINFFFEYGLNILEAGRGHRRWEPCLLGTAQAIYGGSTTQLAPAIHQLLLPGGFDRMRARQEAIYPAPARKGQSVGLMVDWLMKRFPNRSR